MEIYHYNGSLSAIEISNLLFANMSNYTLVAKVETDSLNKAYELTNNMDNIRSTSIGDIIKSGEFYYMVCMIGFQQVDIIKD